MRNLLTTIVLGFAMTASLQAQLMRNLVLVSENHEAFTLFVNQNQINGQALNNVRVSGLNENFYDLTIHTSVSNRILRANLYVPPLSEIVYEFSMPTIQAPNGVFSILALAPILETVQEQSGDFQWGNDAQNDVDVNQGGGINIVINNNVDTDVNTNIDTQTDIPVVEEIVYVDGYSGEIGCTTPLSETRFQNMLATIEDQSFASSKKRIAKQVIRANCMVASHIVDILELFSFESDKLEVAKFAYDYTYDIENYYLINNVFDFESSIEKLDDYINAR